MWNSVSLYLMIVHYIYKSRKDSLFLVRGHGGRAGKLSQNGSVHFFLNILYNKITKPKIDKNIGITTKSSSWKINWNIPAKSMNAIDINTSSRVDLLSSKWNCINIHKMKEVSNINIINDILIPHFLDNVKKLNNIWRPTKW